VNISSSAVALHSVVQQLWSGAVGHAFSRVLWVGHSYGGMLGWTEVSRYHDVDGVIVTGALHHVSPSFVQSALATTSMPAKLDPHFAGLGLDDGYLTTIPATRGNLLYFAPTTDRRVVAVDEANNDTITLAELATGLPLIEAPAPDASPSRLIDVPVLGVIGQRDADFCVTDAADCSTLDSVQRVEAQYYSPEAQLQIVLGPGDRARRQSAPDRAALVRRRTHVGAPPLPAQLDQLVGTPL
jgi:pimeloyl-ACP methyl ester carboxylesterase